MNSRDELALSQAIHIPRRDLAHKQFTVLRKVAGEKNMPMFQVPLNFRCFIKDWALSKLTGFKEVFAHLI